jgi:hypothetical protein
MSTDVRRAPEAASGSEHDWVDAAPFRAQLHWLLAYPGMTPEVIALLAGVAPRLTRRLLTGHGGRPLRRISQETAYRLYAVTPRVLEHCRHQRVPAGSHSAIEAPSEPGPLDPAVVPQAA